MTGLGDLVLRQLLLRVVGHLPVHAAIPRSARIRGQVSDKPRGRKPRGTPRCFEKAPLLWRFGRGRSSENADGCGRWGSDAEAGAGVRVDRRFSGDVQKAAAPVRVGQEVALPGRRLLGQCRQTPGAFGQSDIHRAYSCGGARIVWARVNVCRMIIARPQCTQRKFGGVVLASLWPPSCWAGSSPGTCNSSRTRGRLALRLPLASSP